MADITVTAANVRSGDRASGAIIKTVTAGETITAGMSVYKKASDAEYYRADSNNTAETAGSEDLGIALTNATDGEPMAIQCGGEYTSGATITLGEVYVVSATAGGIAPAGDGASGWYTSILGVASSTAKINLKIDVSGYVRA